MLDADLSPATAHKAVFALRHCLESAVADRRLTQSPASKVSLPSDRPKAPRFLSQAEVEKLVEAMSDCYSDLALVGAYGGLRWGEAAGLTRSNVDALRSRIVVASTAVEIGGRITPETSRRLADRSAQYR